MSNSAGDQNRVERQNIISKTKSAWAQELTSLNHEDDDPGTTWNQRSRKREPQKRCSTLCTNVPTVKERISEAEGNVFARNGECSIQAD